MGSKWGNAGQADGFDGLGRQGHNGHDQPGTASNAHHKSGTQPGQLDITSRRWGKWGKWGKWSRSRPSRSRRKVRKPDLACAFLDRHLYARQSARHVQDYPAVLSARSMILNLLVGRLLLPKQRVLLVASAGVGHAHSSIDNFDCTEPSA